MAGSLLVLLLAFGLRVYRLGHQSLWWDELFTAAGASLSWGAMIDSLLAVRNHVPLYFVLVHLWSRLGAVGPGDAFSLRFLSVLWAVVGVAWIDRLGRLVGGRQAGWVAAFLLAVSPFHIWYSQEARMYAMVATCALAGNWFLLRLLRRDAWGDWVGYGLSMVAAAYTHYLALFVLVAHYAFFAWHARLLKRLFVRWLACSAAVASLVGIWGAVIMSSGGFAHAPIAWIAPARWYEPVLTLLAFAAGPTISLGQPLAYLSLAVCLAATGVCWVRARGSTQRRRGGEGGKTGRREERGINAEAQRRGGTQRGKGDRRRGAGLVLSEAKGLGEGGALAHGEGQRVGGCCRLAFRLLSCWLLVPLLLTWAISWDLPIPQKRSVYMDRYLIVALPAFVMLVAWGLTWVLERKGELGFAALAVLAVAATVALRNLYFDPLYARENWRAAVAYLEARQQPGDVLLLRPSHTLPLAYYADQPIPYREFPFLFDEQERDAYLAQEMAPRVAAMAREWDRAWLIVSVENTDPHGFPHARNASLWRIGQEDAIQAWFDARYRRLEQVFFTGVCLSLYDLSQVSGEGERVR